MGVDHQSEGYCGVTAIIRKVPVTSKQHRLTAAGQIKDGSQQMDDLQSRAGPGRDQRLTDTSLANVLQAME